MNDPENMMRALDNIQRFVTCEYGQHFLCDPMVMGHDGNVLIFQRKCQRCGFVADEWRVLGEKTI